MSRPQRTIARADVVVTGVGAVTALGTGAETLHRRWLQGEVDRLPTEGAKRWERGVDPLLPAYAADRVAHLLVEHGGGTISSGVTYVGAPPQRHHSRDVLDAAPQQLVARAEHHRRRA